MAFDSMGRLYVTDFSAQSVSRFDTSGNLLGTFGGGYSTPEMIVFDLAGNAYVGNVGGSGIRKFDANGNFLQQFGARRVDFLDLAADQRTMLYTQEGTAILRYDVVSDMALSNFASTLGGRAFALRIRPNGEVLLANGHNILRLDANGNVAQTYDQAGEDNWFALNLDPDGTSFWSADFSTGNVYRFDIATGNVLRTFNSGAPGNTFGLAVFGEITVGGGGGGGGQVEGPDLTGSWTNGITQRCFRSGSRRRCQVRGKLRVQNIGTKVALSSVVKYYASTDNTFSQDDTFLGQGVIGLLRPQQAVTTSFNITLPADTDVAGKFIIAVIDSTSVVQESNEGNNQAVTGPVGGGVT